MNRQLDNPTTIFKIAQSTTIRHSTLIFTPSFPFPSYLYPMKRIIGILVVFITLTACQRESVYKSYHTFDNVSWGRFDYLEFEVPVQESQLLDFALLLRHHTYFPYDHLDVNITFTLPDGSFRSRDYHFELKDENGTWKADGMGELWDIELSIREEMSFYESGTCHIRFENKMTKMETPGIIEVGLVVYESER